MAQPDSRHIAYLIGMPRAGTTFLYHNLARHPQISIPFRRKSNYFSLHFNKPESWFLDHFTGLQESQLSIDTETMYFVDPELDSLERIRSFNPAAKGMLIVRSPGEWAYSFYRQISTFDSHVPPFDAFLSGAYTLYEDDVGVPFGMTDGSIAGNIEKARALFGSDLLMVNFDLLARNPLQVLREIENFLDLDAFFDESNFDNRRLNSSDRGNVVWFQNLLRSKLVITLSRALPKSAVVAARRRYDGIMAQTATRRSAPDPESENLIRMASNHFKSDEAFVRTLFADGNIHRG